MYNLLKVKISVKIIFTGYNYYCTIWYNYLHWYTYQCKSDIAENMVIIKI